MSNATYHDISAVICDYGDGNCASEALKVCYKSEPLTTRNLHELTPYKVRESGLRHKVPTVTLLDTDASQQQLGTACPLLRSRYHVLAVQERFWATRRRSTPALGRPGSAEAEAKISPKVDPTKLAQARQDLVETAPFVKRLLRCWLWSQQKSELPEIWLCCTS